MNLKQKMIALSGTMIALLLLIVGVAFNNMSQTRDALASIGEVDIPLTDAMSTVAKGQLAQSAWLERSLLAAELEITEDLNKAIREFSAEHRKIDDAIEASLSIASRSLAGEESQNMETWQAGLKNVRRTYDEYYETGTLMLELLQAGDIVKADTYLAQVQEQSAVLLELIEPLSAEISARTRDNAIGLVNSSESALAGMSVIGLLSILAAAVLGFFITRSVLNQLGADPAQLEQIAEHLAEGRLEIETQNASTGVAESITRTVLKLQEVIRGIQSGAEEVSLASEQVGQGNANLSQRTQEQASSLEEVAASMEEMTSTVNQNAENANQANKLAIEASKQAEDGGSIAARAVTAMKEINDSSKRISEIITVIDDISFQINLLALNAAVEAARAGDQGRGFAVVAGEVRNLAGRSATAAKEIKDLIQDSVEKVDGGSRLVDETGSRLTEIVTSIKMVSDNVAEIAAASQEQSDGIAQVNRAILQMDDMTQQNASLVEQAAAASETVDSQARELRDLIAFFKLKRDSEARPAESASFQNYLEKTVASVPTATASSRKPVLESVSADEEWEQF